MSDRLMKIAAEVFRQVRDRGGDATRGEVQEFVQQLSDLTFIDKSHIPAIVESCLSGRKP